jgi:hypothetical protein
MHENQFFATYLDGNNATKLIKQYKISKSSSASSSEQKLLSLLLSEAQGLYLPLTRSATSLYSFSAGVFIRDITLIAHEMKALDAGSNSFTYLSYFLYCNVILLRSL